MPWIDSRSFFSSGMARDIYQSAVYVSHKGMEHAAHGDEVLTWAPEVLEDDSFSTKSDVWAFGVCVRHRGKERMETTRGRILFFLCSCELFIIRLCWEIFTMGAEPYAGVPRETLAGELQRGLRLTIPSTVPWRLREAVHSCWKLSARERPPFR